MIEAMAAQGGLNRTHQNMDKKKAKKTWMWLRRSLD